MTDAEPLAEAVLIANRMSEEETMVDQRLILLHNCID